jgi:6-pyruvoyltetrahydropterin/6-carboxytetrahydropterin synthase
MLITKTIEIDMGHRIPNHKSKCKNIHGHRYKIEVGVNDKLITKKGDSSEGMVIDFGDLKEIMITQIDNKFDHGFCIYEKDEFWIFFNQLRKEYDQKIIITDFIPTVENLSKHWYELIKPRLNDLGIKIKYIKVWETPTSTARYEE